MGLFHCFTWVSPAIAGNRRDEIFSPGDPRRHDCPVHNPPGNGRSRSPKNACVAQLSFTRALTETRLFLKLLVASTDLDLWPSIWEAFVQCCARHRVNSRPGRQFPRDPQEYRRRNRGLQKKRSPGPKPKSKAAAPLRPKPETRKGSKGPMFLLRCAKILSVILKGCLEAI